MKSSGDAYHCEENRLLVCRCGPDSSSSQLLRQKSYDRLISAVSNFLRRYLAAFS